MVTNLVMLSAQATTFQPVPLNKLLVPANAIVVGDFLDSQAVVLEDGTIATEAHFKLDKEWGIDAEDYGITEIKVFYPGGTVDGKVLTVEGAPRFIPGEKNVLLLGQLDDGRLWVQGLAMGTFKVLRIGGKSILVNPVFPSNPELSQIDLEQFSKQVSAVKNAAMKEMHSDKYGREHSKDQQRMVATEQGNSRSIASVQNGTVPHEPNVLDSFWLVTLLGSMGLIATWFSRRKAK